MKFLLLSVLLFAGVRLAEANPKQLFQAGNLAYAQGDYAAAVDAFTQAAKEAPEKVEILYNLALAQYHSGAVEASIGTFGLAAATTSHPKLRARSLYNQANALVQLAQAKEKKEPAAALELCAQAVSLYRAAWYYDPSFEDTAWNLEATLRITQKLKQAIEKKQEEQQKKNNAGANNSSGDESQEQNDQQVDNENFGDESGMFEDADPFGDFSDYDEIHGVPPPSQSESEILSEEIRHQQQRRQRSGSYKAVEKDW